VKEVPQAEKAKVRLRGKNIQPLTFVITRTLANNSTVIDVNINPTKPESNDGCAC
jgi:hypothetical protein